MNTCLHRSIDQRQPGERARARHQAATTPPLPDIGDVERLALHGRTIAYRQLGAGPVVVLVHGLAGTMSTWDPAIPQLSKWCTVVAVDLPGHGRSTAPHGDHSLGVHASCLRDLLDALGHPAATVIGHSFGGGVALQFAYQYPERCERLVLVSSGGLGNEVSIALRLAALPGAEQLAALAANRFVVGVGSTIARLGAALGVRAGPGLIESARACATLAEPNTRRSFFHTLRAVVDHRGQRVTADERLDLLNNIPNLLIWGDGDRIIPVAHAHETHRRLPHNRFEIFERTGHFPHVAQPGRFAETVRTFIDSTDPALRTLRANGQTQVAAGNGHR